MERISIFQKKTGKSKQVVEIFDTNFADRETLDFILEKLNEKFPRAKINFYVGESRCILRIETDNFDIIPEKFIVL